MNYYLTVENETPENKFKINQSLKIYGYIR